MIAIGLAGGVIGIVLAVRPSSRRAGMGILVVVGLGPPIIAALAVLFFVFSYSE